MKTKIVKKLEGISKREYFSIMIMQGLCSIDKDSSMLVKNPSTMESAKFKAINAVLMADALMEELSKGKK